MADEQIPANPEGIPRTTDGQILDQSPSATEPSANTNPETAPAATKPDLAAKPATLLNQQTKPDPAKPEAKPGAPEKYEDYKVPEGFTLNPEVKTQADGLFKGLGLNQEQAQSLVDFYMKQTAETAAAPYKAYQEMTDGWRKEAEAHPDLSGKLGPGQEVNVRIGKFLSGLPDQKLASDFRSLMDLTGAGNHPAFIRVLDYAAQRMTEGTHVSGNGPTKPSQSAPGQAPPTAAAAMWPNLPSSRQG